MIIKMTVNDNDFGNLMNGFVSKLGLRISEIPSNIKELNIDKQLEIIDEIRNIDRLLNPNITESHTDDEKALIIKKVTEAFTKYVNQRCSDSADYLIKNFKAEIINSMEDKWENGEVWYWFQHSRTCLCQ